MIRILDSFIADKIAAGEVIERPLSIVKELVENSVDAGSSQIIVEIRNGGKSYIRVTDNGSGIPRDEVELAFERHATGKIRTLADLGHIETLGFRGEALASITAISRLTIFTKTADSVTGTKLVMHGGKKVSLEEAGMNDGTTMVIEDVFYNTPARRKFMKSDAAEASVIIDLIQKLAIFYSHIAFRMINNGQTVLATPGKGDTLQTITSIYPTYKDLIEIKGEHVHGFISNPGVTKNTRRGQIFFVNGRIVRSAVIEKGIKAGYGDRVFSGYPIAVLFLEVDPESIDVNIHPSKKEIKFLDGKEVSKEIEAAVRSVLYTQEAVPSATKDKGAASDVSGKNSSAMRTNSGIAKSSEQMNIRQFLSSRERPAEGPLTRSSETPIATKPSSTPIAKPAGADSASVPSIREQLMSRREPERPEISPKRDEINDLPSIQSSHDRDIINVKEEPVIYEAQAPEQTPLEVAEAVIEEPLITLQPPAVRMFDFNELTVKGYVFDTYIIMQAGNTLYVLDQHAAHERIMYERLVGRYNSEQHLSQPMLMPMTLQTSSDLYNGERGWLRALVKLGYVIEDFGADTFQIREIPEYMDSAEARIFAEQYLEASADEDDLRNTVVIDKLIMRSCKAAVKGNNRLSDKEIKELLVQLESCVNPFSCPHGRPTFIKLTKAEIERAFKRQ